MAVGIDLGTTFSALARINEFQKPELVKNCDGKTLTPSVVAVCVDPPAVGDEAKQLQAVGEEGVASFFKRAMGDPNWRFEVAGGVFTPTDLSALVLGKLKADAELELNHPVTDAVITVPAYFNNDQREATKAAGEAAGLNVLLTINEPTAAALDFGFGGRIRGKVMVYDLGGGTFDVTVIEIDEEDIRVLATAGDHELGGKNWDDRLAEFIAGEFYDEHGEQPLDDRESSDDVLVAAEQAKIALSSVMSTKMRIAHAGIRAAYTISREQFNGLTGDLLERTSILAENVLRDLSLAWSDLSGVLLVGGSTRMPMVGEFVQSRFGSPAITGVNVDEAVARGAAIQANQLLGQQGGRTEYSLPGAPRLHDVTSHSLGVVALDQAQQSYVNSIIIPKNSSVPCTKSRPFQAPKGSAAGKPMEIYVLQGESRDPEQCVASKKYVLSDWGGVQGEASVITIGYGYDANGIITVEAKDSTSGSPLSLKAETIAEGDNWLARLNDALRFDPSSLRLTVTSPCFDDIGNVLSSMNVTFGGYQEQGLDCDILFLNCGTGDNMVPNELRDFVQRGGCLYASDLASSHLTSAFSGLFHFAGDIGEVGHVEAEVVDPELQEAIGTSIRVHFDMGAWSVLARAPDDGKTLLRSKATGAPLMVMVPYGEGTIFYTCFHNHAQASEAEQELLQRLVMKQMSVVAGVPVEMVAGAIKRR